MEEWLKLLPIHPGVHRHGITHYVQVAVCKIDEPLTPLVLDVRFGDVPFLGHGPIECDCAAGDLVQLHQWNELLDVSQRRTNAVSGEAAAYRE